jgi:hypothetical protein
LVPEYIGLDIRDILFVPPHPPRTTWSSVSGLPSVGKAPLRFILSSFYNCLAQELTPSQIKFFANVHMLGGKHVGTKGNEEETVEGCRVGHITSNISPDLHTFTELEDICLSIGDIVGE